MFFKEANLYTSSPGLLPGPQGSVKFSKVPSYISVFASLMDPIEMRPSTLIAEVESVRSKKPKYSIEPSMALIVVGRLMLLKESSAGAGTIWRSP